MTTRKFVAACLRLVSLALALHALALFLFSLPVLALGGLWLTILLEAAFAVGLFKGAIPLARFIADDIDQM